MAEMPSVTQAEPSLGKRSPSQSDLSPGEPSGDGNPFPGPKAYRRAQNKLFFGRKDEIDELTSLVLSSSAVLLYAASGSGKSSLLQAGLVPSLEHFGFRILPTVRFGRVGLEQPVSEASRARANPFTEVVRATVAPDSVPPRGAEDLVQLAACLHKDSRTSTLLVLDQFEELFSNSALWRERGEFLEQLHHALTGNSWLRAFVAIRSDHLANLIPHERELPGRMLVRYGLDSLDEGAAREVIEESFDQTAVRITPPEVKLVLDHLLNLEVGSPGSPPVRGQHVNLIQLQILCRRLWEEKARATSLQNASASQDPPLLRESDVDLTNSMRSFVDSAVIGVVAQTHADEGVIRRWLQDRLITPGGRRAVLPVEDEKTTGLPKEVVKELEKARLVQVEQRNRSRWAELTHDSMIAAVQASNIAWIKTRRRYRHRLTAVLTVLVTALVMLFPVLRGLPEDTLLAEAEVDGVIDNAAEVSPVRIPFRSAPEGRVAAVQIHLKAERESLSGATVRVIARAEGEKQDSVLTSKSVAGGNDGVLETTINFVVETKQQLSTYAVVIDTGDAPYPELSYQVAVNSAPVVLDEQKIRSSTSAKVTTSVFAVKLGPDRPVTLEIQDGQFEQVFGARSLLESDSRVVLESSGKEPYAVLQISGPYGYDLVSPATVTGGVVERFPNLRFGAATSVRGAFAAMSLIRINKADSPFAVEASCRNLASLDVIDATGRAVKGTAQLQQSVLPDTSALVPLVPAGDYRVILGASSASEELACSVKALSFKHQQIVEPGNGTLRVDKKMGYNAYSLRLRDDSVVIVNKLGQASASLDCPANISNVTESNSGRLLAFAPRGRNCMLFIARPYGDPTERGLSFPVRVVPVSDE